MEDDASSENDRLRGLIPAAAATARGLEYYVRLVERRVDDSDRVLSFPNGPPGTTPAQVRVRFDTLPAEGTFAPKQYRMISVPAALDSATVDDVLADDLGPYDNRQWRLLTWNADTEQYDELVDGERLLTPGRSYWLISRIGTGFDVGAGRSTDLQTPFSLTLAPGWHQISSPFAFPVAWSRVDGSECRVHVWRPAGTLCPHGRRLAPVRPSSTALLPSLPPLPDNVHPDHRSSS